MARRSSRLVSGGYYNSDEESDSSSVTNISYRETPVKVFKKKAGTRKPVSRTPSRANSNASSVGTETPITAGQYEAPPPSPLIRESAPPMRTVPFLPSSIVTTRPPLTPSPSTTPPRYPSLPPERSLYSGLGCSIRPGFTSGAELKERTQSGVESSGYSSCEGPLLWKTPSNTRNTSKGPSAGYWGRIRGAFYSLMAASVGGRTKKAFALLLLFLIALLCVWLLPPLLTPLVSRLALTVLFTSSPPLHQPNSIQPAHLVDPALVSAAVEERIRYLLGPSLVLAAVEEKIQRLLDPAVVSAAVEAKMQRLLDPAVVSAAVGAKMQRLLDPAVVSAAIELKMQSLLDPAVVSAAVETKMQRLLDPAVVSAAVEAKMETLLDSAVVSSAVEVTMQRLLEEQQLKQELSLSQMKESLQLDLKDRQDLNNLQDLKAQLLVLDSENRQLLLQEASALSQRMEDHQTESLSASEALRVRIQTLEQQNSKFSQEWSSLQMTPPPAPCPEPGLPPVQQQLTPELQKALEKWLSDRIKDQASLRLTGSCSDCGRPDADKMADFALETQGASVISTRCSETYRIRSACVTLFGFPLWYPSESPRTVIQGSPVLLPGKCWAFHGVQGTLLISLSHPITVSHVTLDHLPRYNSPTGRIDSAPRDLQVYGMREESEDGSLLGTFTYHEDGESTQTFKLPISSVVYRLVELRVLSNWGHVDYTCLYRFRVHGQIPSS